MVPIDDRYRLGRARAQALPTLQDIEDEAGRRYGTVGIDPDLPGLSLADLQEGLHDDLLWVIEEAGKPVAFALAWARPGALHLREIDVLPAHGGRGLGVALIERVRREAASRNAAQVTLTTFADVPWNRPYYERRGFTVIARDRAPGWLARILESEVAAGLHRWPRVAMALGVQQEVA